MKSTLRKKYFLVIISIVVVSFSILASLLLGFVTNQWEKEKRELFTNHAKSVAAFVERYVQTEKHELTILDIYTLQNLVMQFSTNFNSDTFVSDAFGKILLCSNDTADYLGKNIPEDILQQTKSGEYIQLGTANGFFRQKKYIVATPIYKDKEKNNVWGVTFVICDTATLNASQTEILKVFLLVLIGTSIFAFLATWLFAYKTVKPIEQMVKAIKAFSVGDFSSRINVKSKDEIGTLAISFNSMADNLESSENVRRNFISNVSHELKTPMTTISGFIDGILDGTIPPDKETHYLKIVSAETKRLSKLVSTMLNLSRIDNGNVKLIKKPFDISKVVIDVLRSFEKSISDKSINLQCDDISSDLFVNADIDMIYQVVYNLVENAVKFTDENGHINANLTSDDKKIIFKLRNSCSGISNEDLPKIFDRFYKGDKSRSKDKNSIGLGLYLVKSIIKLHDGEVFVASSQGRYCEFTFELPQYFFEN